MHFLDPARQQRFEKYGYLVMDLLTESDIRKLRDIYDRYPPRQVANFQVSNYEKDTEKNKVIDAAIKSVIAGPISERLSGYKLLSAFFYIKFPGSESAFYIHKDWNIVDESKYTSLHIWIPLTETNAENGNLFMCPYDYRKQFSFRGSPGFEFPEPGFLTRLANNLYKVDVYTKPGQAICFDHRMTHGSRANRTDAVRVSAGISLVPEEAPVVHYHQNEQGRIEKYEIAEDFYLDFNLTNLSIKS